MGKSTLIELHWFLASQFGLDPLRFILSLRGLPRFIRDWWQFLRVHGGLPGFVPCLHDRFEEGGTKSEYLWSDPAGARWIHDANPQRHVDVGSRVDGFVAHVASFREIEVFDVRPVTSRIPGIRFRQADLMDMVSLSTDGAEGYCDSLPCLHAIEHFGQGRYGDPIDPRGYEQGLANMAVLLKPGGDVIPIRADRTRARRVQRKLGVRSSQHPQACRRARVTAGSFLCGQRVYWSTRDSRLRAE